MITPNFAWVREEGSTSTYYFLFHAWSLQTDGYSVLDGPILKKSKQIGRYLSHHYFKSINEPYEQSGGAVRQQNMKYLFY